MQLVYTFDLRDDVLFHDGTPLTSDDVKYSIEYTIDPANKASRGPIFNRLSHVETDGPHRLHVHLKEPFAPWTAFLTKFMGVWPEGIAGEIRQRLFPPDAQGCRHRPRHVRGMEAERLRQPARAIRITGRKGLPHWDRLVVKIVPEDATRVAYLLSGQADIIGAPPPREFSRLKTRRGIQGAADADVRRLDASCSRTPASRRSTISSSARPSSTRWTARRSPKRSISAWWNRPASRPRPQAGGTTRRPTTSPPTTWIWRKQHLAKSRYPNGTEFDMDCQLGAVSAGCQGRGGVHPGGAGEAEHQGQSADDRPRRSCRRISWAATTRRGWRTSCRRARRPTS